MTIGTITPAARRSLTTVARVRADRVLTLDLPDSLVEMLIARASAMIERAVGYQLARERVVERTRSNGSRIWLSRRPLVEVHAFIVGESVVEAGGYVSDLASITLPASSHDWLLDAGDDWGGYGIPRGLVRPSAAREFRDFSVEYTAGYVTPGWPPPDDVPNLPPELEWACMILVKAQADMRTRASGLRSESLGDASWTYGDPKEAGSLPPEVIGLLAPYRAAMA